MGIWLDYIISTPRIGLDVQEPTVESTAVLVLLLLIMDSILKMNGTGAQGLFLGSMLMANKADSLSLQAMTSSFTTCKMDVMFIPQHLICTKGPLVRDLTDHLCTQNTTSAKHQFLPSLNW